MCSFICVQWLKQISGSSEKTASFLHKNMWKEPLGAKGWSANICLYDKWGISTKKDGKIED